MLPRQIPFPLFLKNNGDKKGLPFNSSCPLFLFKLYKRDTSSQKNVTEEKINRGKKTVENEEGKNLNRIAQKKSL